MKVASVDMLNGYTKDDDLTWGGSEPVNWIPEITEGPTRSRLKLVDAPGLSPHFYVSAFPIRGIYSAQNRLYFVSGTSLYEVIGENSPVVRGTIPGIGRVEFTHLRYGSGYQIVAVNGSAGYVWNTSNNTFGRITDSGFAGASTIDALDQYLLYTEPFGRFWGHSEVADATQYNTLDRSESEASPDRLVTVRANQLEAVAFNEKTIEFFSNTGATTGTFRPKRIAIDRGCAGKYTVVRLDNSLLWLGDDGVFYRLDGYSARPISTGSIEKAIRGWNWAQCFAFSMQEKHHKIAYWTFPDGQTFGYDVVTGLWHRRQSFGRNRWRVNGVVEWNGRHWAGDAYRGIIHEVSWEVSQEDGEPIEREFTSGPAHNDQNPISVPRVELLFETGGPERLSAQTGDTLAVTGNLPDGYQEDVVSFQYNTTGGVEPIVFTLLSGSLPTGLTVNAAGLVTGTVTAGGTFSWVLRVTSDDTQVVDHADSATFTAAKTALALGRVSNDPAQRRTLASPNGSNWGGTVVTPSTTIGVSNRLMGLDSGRFVALSLSATDIYRTDDNGATWSSATCSATSSSNTSGTFVGGVININAADGFVRSTDRGATFSAVTGGASTSTIAGHTGLLVALRAPRNLIYSTDNGATWSAPGIRLDTLPTPLSVERHSASDGTRIIIAGSTVSGGGAPAVAITTDGIAANVVVLSGPTTRYITQVAFGRGLWVAGCNDGTFYVSSDSGATWQVSSGSLGQSVATLTFNGVFFIAGGGSTGTTAIKTSVDGNNWTTRTSGMSYEIMSIASNV